MKKSLILAAIVLISASCMAQKNASIKKAKSMVNTESPDFNAARALVAEGLAAEPTAENYYWAGFVNYKQVQLENYNLVSGGTYEVSNAGPACVASYEHWLKADELAQVPVLNKKGVEVPTDPKMRAKVAKLMLEYYKNQDLIKYGIYLNEQKDYEGAFKAFKMHIDIPDLAMMQTDKLQKEMPRDTIYNQYKYYAAIFAIQAEHHEDAIKLLEDIKEGEYEALSINQFLYQEYVTLNDTAKFVEQLHYAINRFPEEEWFMQNLVNYSVSANKEAEAVEYLNKLIEANPTDLQYIVKRGVMNEMLERTDDAMRDFDKALELNPNSADAYAGKGRLYYNKAVKMNEDAKMIDDNRAYNKAMKEANDVFRQSMPYFEKAHLLDPSRRSFIETLKSLYYRFSGEPGMEDKYNAMAEKLNNL